MHWIIEDNPHSETTQVFIKALTELNIPFSVHKIIPIAGVILGDLPSNEGKVTCYGPYSMRNHLVEHNYFPGTYDLEDFDFTVQRQNWGEQMLNFDSEVVKFKDVKEWDNSEVRFLRPIKDSKVFAGNVFEWKEFAEWQNKIVNLKEDYGDTLNGETLVQVAMPTNIYQEYRMWVVDGKVIEGSKYRENLRLKMHNSVPEEVLNYTQECVEIWKPHDAFVIDIALLKSGEMKIIEINTFNAAGIYAADVKKIISAIEKMEATNSQKLNHKLS